ncbi:MAG: radical SAM protein [Candidatus Aminicenantes bacterium]|nr:MAG: radical SAM protein [Candidatus Aminicenantes bacterium]
MKNQSETILLALLPFWDPQIPPLGIACLKSYLQQHGCKVKSVDANLEPQFRELRDSYYENLQNMIPVDKQGNIFNIGNQVMRNHLMAHLNKSQMKMDENRYGELLKILVMKTFFTDVDTDRLLTLDNLLAEFYTRLKTYVMDLLARENPTLLGLTVYGDTFPASVAAFQWAKQKNPSIITVMGGGIFADQLAPGSPELDYFMERSTNYIDKMIIGEGEELLLKLLQGELDQSQRVFGLRDLYRPKESSGVTTWVDLNQVDVPDYRDFHLEYYPHLAHYGARSCPYQCKFCSETINWGKYRKKQVQQTVRELIQLQQRHSYQLFLLTDSTLNPIITDLSKEFIKSGVTIYWDGFLRADSHAANMSNTLLWRRGGFYRAKLGLESGSQQVLDLMNKRITLQQSEATLAALAYAGIKTTTFWLFGFPGETDEDFQLTLDFLERNKDCIYEADCNAFNYYLTGQANSEEWLKNNKGILLYPKWAREWLITQTWVLDTLPTREEAYKRINRFVRHCNKLGIPNPYSLKDVYKADERWKKLHKNAVPSMVELKNRDLYLDENKHVKEFSFAENKWADDGDWF